MRNIAIIIYDLRGGGMERHMLNLFSYFDNTQIGNNKIELITIYPKNDYIRQYPNDLLNKIRCLVPKKNLNFLKKIYYTCDVFKGLYKLHKKNNYSIYIFSEPITWIFCLYIKIITRQKTVIFLGTNKIHYLVFQNPFWKVIFHLLFLNLYLCDSVLCPSLGIKKDLIRSLNINKRKITVIPNSIIPDTLVSIPSKNKNIYSVLSVGRFVPQKNFELLIQCFKLVVSHQSNIRLLLVGDGPLRNKLQQLINDNCLKKYIRILTFRNPMKYYSQADLFVLPSVHEGFGNVIVEAMRFGLPIISTDSNFGPREIIAANSNYFTHNASKYIRLEKFGVLISNSLNIDEKAKLFAKAILLLINQKKLRNKYSKMSIKRAEFYSGNRIANKYASFFKKLS